MTDTPTDTSLPAPTPPSRSRGRGRTAFVVVLIALAVGVTALFANYAFSQPGFGPGFGHGGWHGRGFMMGRMDPAQIEDRADRMVRHLAIEIDATAEQQERLRAVVKSAVKDLLPMREKAQAARQRGRELLLQQNIDRTAIEAFRVEQMALADTASKRITQAFADAASILTAEQRQKIGDRLRPHPGFWGGWRRG
jgi:Spy/CpxP family protein refolding chaperone